MDLLSRIAGWLGENEATISAVIEFLADDPSARVHLTDGDTDWV